MYTCIFPCSIAESYIGYVCIHNVDKYIHLPLSYCRVARFFFSRVILCKHMLVHLFILYMYTYSPV